MSRRAQERLAAEARARQRIGWSVAAVVFAAALVGVVLALSGGDGSTSAAPGEGVRVSMTEFAFQPDPIVLSGDQRSVTVVNDGAAPHDFVVPELGKGTPDLPAGAELTIDLSAAPAGTYEVICDITGHREAGMVTELVLRP